jgi:hypothetical protein
VKRRHTTVLSSPKRGDATFRSLWLRQSGGRSVTYFLTCLSKQSLEALKAERPASLLVFSCRWLLYGDYYLSMLRKSRLTLSVLIALNVLLTTPTASADIFGESTCSKLSKKLQQPKYANALKKDPTKRTRIDWGNVITYAVAEVNYPSCFTSQSVRQAKSFLKEVGKACKANRQFSSACIYSPFGKQFFPIDWL